MATRDNAGEEVNKENLTRKAMDDCFKKNYGTMLFPNINRVLLNSKKSESWFTPTDSRSGTNAQTDSMKENLYNINNPLLGIIGNTNYFTSAGDVTKGLGDKFLANQAWWSNPKLQKVLDITGKAGKVVTTLGFVLNGVKYVTAENEDEKNEALGRAIGTATGIGLGSLVPLPGVGMALGGIAGDHLGGVVGKNYNNIVGWVNDKADIARAWLLDSTTRAVDWVNESTNDAGAWITEAWNQTGTWFNDASSKAGTWITETSNQTGAWFNNASSEAGAWISDAWNQTGNWFNNASSEAGAWISDAWNQTGDWFSNASSEAGAWITDATNQTGDWFSNASSEAGAWITDATNQTGAWFNNASSKAGSWISDASNQTGAWFNNASSKAGSWISNASNQTGAWISDKSTKAGTWIGETSSRASDWIKGAPSWIGNWFKEDSKENSKARQPTKEFDLDLNTKNSSSFNPPQIMDRTIKGPANISLNLSPGTIQLAFQGSEPDYETLSSNVGYKIAAAIQQAMANRTP